LAANRAALGKNELRGDAAGPGAGKARWPLIVPQVPDYPNRSRYSAERRRHPRLAPLLSSRGRPRARRPETTLRLSPETEFDYAARLEYATSKALPIGQIRLASGVALILGGRHQRAM